MKIARHRICSIAFFVLLNLACSTAICQSKANSKPTSFWPSETKFDDSIVSPKQFFGFEIGQRHLDHAQLVAYLTELAGESDRIKLQTYGKTHAGRPLLLLTISSPKNLANLESIGKQHRLLANPSRSDQVDISKLPAVINMGYGVHGDEASATNCAPLVAHFLAAAQGEEIESWLDNCVILMDPSLNPDGFNRFANWVNGYRGKVPNDDPQHREHNQAWPSGRVNYYWFDLNRDWLPLEHPESRSRMRWYHAWKPNVVLDFHEMGTNTTYFFQPGVPNRTNPLTPAKNVELTAEFAKYHGQALDQRGSAYFTQERFDDFYMGKGSTYPDLHGAVGILFEQASARGHVQRNQDGRLTFHKAIANHFSTSRSSLKATSELRTELLNYKRDFYKESLATSGREKKSAFVFSCAANPTRLQDFADVLLRHDIQCYWPKERLEIDDVVLSARDSLVVPIQQAEYRFLKSLLMRRKKFKENIFYDVSSWTLPLAYGLKQSALQTDLDFAKLTKAKLNQVRGFEFRPHKNAIGYLVDWRNDHSCQLLNQLLEQGINVKLATQPFVAQIDDQGQGKSFERGTLSIQLGVQKRRAKMIEKTLKAASRKGVAVYPVFAGLALDGPDLGSERFRKIELPKIAMPVGPGISQYEAGEIWHLLDQRHGVQLTMLNTSQISKYDLREYSTFLFPSGSYQNWSDKDWEAVKDEIKHGATAIAMGSTCGLIKERLDGKNNSMSANSNKANEEIQLDFDTKSRAKALQLISGAILKTKIDLSHPLYFGFSSKRIPVFRNHAQFLQPSEDPYRNPSVYDSAAPHMAGYCSEENVDKIRGAASVVVTPIGRGCLIQISDNPNFRSFWHGTSRLFLNAIFFGKFVK